MRGVACGWLMLWLVISSTARAGDRSILADAAEKGDLAAVRAALKRGADVNLQQPDGTTALHWAVYHDHEDLAQQLIDAGANVATANRYGVRPLSIACLNGNGTIVRGLLEAGADPGTALPGGETALMTAARTGRIGPVEALLARGAEVNAKGPQGQTALMWAAAEGNLVVVEALLRAEADFRTPLASGFTPLFFAVREGRTDVVRRLLQGGLDVNAAMSRSNNAQRPGPNPLILAVENGHFQTAVALLDAGADPNAQPAGYAALHAMSWVRKPIRGDGNPSPIGSGKVSGLQLVRALVARGADVNIRLARGHSGLADFTTTGCSPLVLAARTGDLPLIRLLLELGADPAVTNADHSSALLAACGLGDLGSGDEAAGSEDEAIETVKLLLKLGLDVNAVDDNGETAMHGAAYQNWPRLVQVLADNGADVRVWHRENKWGWTPLLIAQGYRKGNFRPDPTTIGALERAMRAAGVTPPPPPRAHVVANQQSWDKKKADAKEDTKRAPRNDGKSPGSS